MFFQEVNKYVENVKRRFGSFNVAESKSKLVPGDLDLYLNDMIPGYRDRSKQANDSANDSSTSTDTDSDLEQSRSVVQIANIKLEPIVITDDSSVDAEGPAKVHNDVAQIVIAQQNEMIDKLKAELRAKNEDLAKSIEQLRRQNEVFDGQRAHWERLLQEAHAKLIYKVRDAKNKQWCSECNEQLVGKPLPLCEVCKIFQ